MPLLREMQERWQAPLWYHERMTKTLKTANKRWIRRSCNEVTVFWRRVKSGAQCPATEQQHLSWCTSYKHNKFHALQFAMYRHSVIQKLYAHNNSNIRSCLGKRGKEEMTEFFLYKWKKLKSIKQCVRVIWATSDKWKSRKADIIASSAHHCNITYFDSVAVMPLHTVLAILLLLFSKADLVFFFLSTFNFVM